jgi:hypothetical protein
MTPPSPPDVEPAAPSPAYAPWYRSAVMQAALTILCTIALKGLAMWLKKHDIDLDLSALGLTPDTLADYIVVTVIPAALGYAVHGRTSKPLPTLTLTKAAADTANSSVPPK